MLEENYVYQYIIDEANLLLDTLEKVCYEYKLVASLDGGCIQAHNQILHQRWCITQRRVYEG